MKHLDRSTGYVGEISMGGNAFMGVFPSWSQVTIDATDGALDPIPAAAMLGGLILRDPAGGNRADKSAPAADLIAAMGAPTVGQTFMFIIRNTADQSETITFTTNTGITLSGTMTIAQNNTKIFVGVVTGAASVTIYSIGTLTH